MTKITCFLFSLLFFINIGCTAQECNYDLSKIKFFNKSINKSTLNYNSSSKKLNKKYLKRFFKSEKRLNRKLCKINPSLADYLFSTEVNPIYFHQNEIINGNYFQDVKIPQQYNSTLDTGFCVISFLLTKKDSVTTKEFDYLSKTNENIKESELNDANAQKLQSYFRSRKITIKETLSKYPELKNDVTGYDKINYYYKECNSKLKDNYSDNIKRSLNDHKLLTNNKEFSEFISKYGKLTGINKIPSTWGQSTNGLQTNLETKQLVNNTIAKSPGIDKIVSKEILPMKQTLNKMKNADLSGYYNAADVPDFKPNKLKTMPLHERLKPGFNYQITKSNWFYPCQMNIQLQLNYQLFENITIGTGVFTFLNFGNSWNERELSMINNGAELRLDVKAIKSLYFEAALDKYFIKSYDQSEFKRANVSFFQSVLAGLKYKKKITKNHSITYSILYDFYYDQHQPETPQLIYRFGLE